MIGVTAGTAHPGRLPASARTLVVAGNAHTPIRPAELGVPMGARLAGQQPGTREVQDRYGDGSYYNCEPRRFARRIGQQGTIRLHQHRGKLLLDLPAATKAVVPQRRAHDHRPGPVTFIAEEE